MIQIIIQINIIKNRKMKMDVRGERKNCILIMIIIIQREHKLNIKTK